MNTDISEGYATMHLTCYMHWGNQKRGNTFTLLCLIYVLYFHPLKENQSDWQSFLQFCLIPLEIPTALKQVRYCHLV